MQFFSDIGTKHSWIKTISPFFFISSLSQYILPFCASYKLATHSPAFGAMVSKLLSQFFLAKPFPFSWTKFTWIFVCVSWHNYYPRIQTKRILFMSKWTLKPYRRVRGDIIFPTCVGMNRQLWYPRCPGWNIPTCVGWTENCWCSFCCWDICQETAVRRGGHSVCYLDQGRGIAPVGKYVERDSKEYRNEGSTCRKRSFWRYLCGTANK